MILLILNPWITWSVLHRKGLLLDPVFMVFLRSRYTCCCCSWILQYGCVFHFIFVWGACHRRFPRLESKSCKISVRCDLTFMLVDTMPADDDWDAWPGHQQTSCRLFGSWRNFAQTERAALYFVVIWFGAKQNLIGAQGDLTRLEC